MTGKESILAAVKQNKPPLKPHPEVPLFLEENTDLLSLFQTAVETGGGKFIRMQPETSLTAILQQYFSGSQQVASAVPGFRGNIDLNQIEYPQALSQVDVAILPASLGVAENGAVWLTEADCLHRVLPFITQHLIILLNEENIVSNMHVAYDRIDLAGTGFGVFIAGPSKTADIEQALVIGAQGARSFTVVVE